MHFKNIDGYALDGETDDESGELLKEQPRRFSMGGAMASVSFSLSAARR